MNESRGTSDIGSLGETININNSNSISSQQQDSQT